jgi:hypothetical protein
MTPDQPRIEQLPVEEAKTAVGAINQSAEYAAFTKWYSWWVPGKPMPEASSHILDAWLASARHRIAAHEAGYRAGVAESAPDQPSIAPGVERRQEVAAIIDPHSFLDIPFTDTMLLDMVEQSKGNALRKADRILALLSTPRPADGESAIVALIRQRADECVDGLDRDATKSDPLWTAHSYMHGLANDIEQTRPTAPEDARRAALEEAATLASNWGVIDGRGIPNAVACSINIGAAIRALASQPQAEDRSDG